MRQVNIDKLKESNKSIANLYAALRSEQHNSDLVYDGVKLPEILVGMSTGELEVLDTIIGKIADNSSAFADLTFKVLDYKYNQEIVERCHSCIKKMTDAGLKIPSYDELCKQADCTRKQAIIAIEQWVKIHG